MILLENFLRLESARGRRYLYSPSRREGLHSRKLVVASPATNIPFYSAQTSVIPYSCCLLPGCSHTCCEGLLRGATGCCSRVAGELSCVAICVCVAGWGTQD